MCWVLIDDVAETLSFTYVIKSSAPDFFCLLCRCCRSCCCCSCYLFIRFGVSLLISFFDSQFSLIRFDWERIVLCTVHLSWEYFRATRQQPYVVIDLFFNISLVARCNRTFDLVFVDFGNTEMSFFLAQEEEEEEKNWTFLCSKFNQHPFVCSYELIFWINENNNSVNSSNGFITSVCFLFALTVSPFLCALLCILQIGVGHRVSELHNALVPH